MFVVQYQNYKLLQEIKACIHVLPANNAFGQSTGLSGLGCHD